VTAEVEKVKVRCPKCGAEIDSLKVYGKLSVIYYLELWDGEPVLSFWDSGDDIIEPEVYCPACGALLFKDVEEAGEFLKSGSARKR
jgi:predicted RNA-binding Zn-ribbon protein involved in translation (DUF1610 family)